MSLNHHKLRDIDVRLFQIPDPRDWATTIDDPDIGTIIRPQAQAATKFIVLYSHNGNYDELSLLQ